jgi:branched-chain amino acid transport system substrate-binding protein
MKGKVRVFVLLAAALVLAVSSTAMAADTIKLGVGGAHSGDLASYGISALRGAEYVVEKVNAAGGINGKQVEMIRVTNSASPNWPPTWRPKWLPTA